MGVGVGVVVGLKSIPNFDKILTCIFYLFEPISEKCISQLSIDVKFIDNKRRRLEWSTIKRQVISYLRQILSRLCDCVS